MGDSAEVARHFGRNMQRLRKCTGMSQEELGYRATLHRTEIGLLERGARVPRIDTLLKVAGALGIRIDCALLEGIAWNTGSVRSEAGNFKLSGPAHGPGEG